MRFELTMLLSLFILFTASCSKNPTQDDLKLFAATETYPEDNFFDTVSNKRALVIVAHDDDDCAMSGTISKLNKAGWKIKQLSFVAHPIDGGDGNNPATIICDGNEIIIDDGLYRYGLDTMKTPYLPIPLADFEKQFLHEKVTGALEKKINDYDPSVIFTLDHVKGGYGHPEHIFISRLILDLFEENRIGNKRIYQSVYTDHMEMEIVDTWLKKKMEKWGYPHASTIANALYGIDGMPEPTIQVTITDQSETKMKYLRAYPEEVRKNLRKFIPYYEDFDATTYFAIFDREFFRVIER